MSKKSQNPSTKIRFPIRVTVPLALLIFVSAITSLTLYISRKQVIEEVTQEATRDLRWVMTYLESSLERAARNGDIETMQEEVTALGANPIITRAILIDENAQVVASTNNADVGNALRTVLRRDNLEFNLLKEKEMNTIKTSLAGKIEELNDDRTLCGVYPVILGVRSREVRPTKVGSLIVLADIAAIKVRALAAVSRQAFEILFLLAVFAAAMGAFFHCRISRRIGRLVDVAEQIGAGNMEIESGIRGHDEIAALGTSLDTMILDRRTAVKELYEREQRLQAVLETAIEAIITINPVGVVETVNSATQKIFGYTREEVIGNNVNMLMPSPYREEHDTYLANYLQTGKKKIIGIGREVVGRRKDGSEFPMELAVSEVHCGKRKIFTGFVRDITERKQSEKTNASLGRILEDSLNEIYIFDADTLRFIQANRGARDNIGYSMDELNKLTPIDIRPEYTREKFIEQVTALQTNELEKIEFETDHRRKDGSIYNVEVHLQLNSYQGRAAFIAIILDITDRKHAEGVLARMNEELEQRVDERTRQLRTVQQELVRKERLAILGQLAGSVAHELRNPMGILKNAAYYIENTSENKDEHTMEAFAEIERALKTSDRIISELLDYAREPKREIAKLPIPEIVDRVLRDITIPSSIKLRTEIVDLTLTSRGDHDQIERLLINLIQNAIQAMPDGGTLTLCGYKNKRNVVVEITDTGIGIAAEEKEKIFLPLYSNKVKGIGLGLSIAKRYAELNAGELDVESEEGKGSTFRLMLPLKTD